MSLWRFGTTVETVGPFCVRLERSRLAACPFESTIVAPFRLTLVAASDGLGSPGCTVKSNTRDVGVDFAAS